MKNSKKLLACTLGLMLGVGFLVGCGSNGDTPTTEQPAAPTTYTVTFKDGNEEVKVETVVAGEKCPEYIPADKEGYDFMGWYVSRSVRDETTKFDFNTPINSNTTLYAWYKAEFKASTDTYFVVGSFTGVDYGTGDGFGPGSYWDGEANKPVQENRKLVLNQDKLAEEKNVFEFTVDLINFGEKFRLIKSTDGLVSDGWVDTFGYDLVSKVLDKDGNELKKAEMLTSQDSKNIGVNFSGKLHISLTLESDFSPNGEIVLTILEEASIVTPEYVSFVGSFPASNWNDDVDLTTADEGFTWTGSHDFAVGETWKLRMNHEWASSWGFDNLRNYPAEALENEPNADGNGFSGNIRVLIAGTYTVTFDYLAMKIDVTYVPGEVEEEPVAKSLVITKDNLTMTDSSQSSGYAKYAGTREIDGVEVTTTDVMVGKNDNYNGQEFLQFKKSTGTLSVSGTYKSITVVAWSSYDWKAVQLEVKVNDEVIAGPDAATVNASRTDTGLKSGNYTIYEYTYTIELDAATEGTFSVRNADGYAFYATSITLA